MNQPDYFDVPTGFLPDFTSAYGQDTQGYWLQLNLFQQALYCQTCRKKLAL